MSGHDPFPPFDPDEDVCRCGSCLDEGLKFPNDPQQLSLAVEPKPARPKLKLRLVGRS